MLDSSIDEENIGEKTAISFLIDMNKLFEKFVVNILRETLPQIDHKYEIQEQKKGKTINKFRISKNKYVLKKFLLDFLCKHNILLQLQDEFLLTLCNLFLMQS